MSSIANITRTTLKNGLTVIIKELHTAPVATFWIWYRVGSRNEPTGRTGISHWVEHMQFKGTETFPGDEVDKEVSRNGGQWNAMTSLDWTTYYQTLPADKIDLALRLEADRMVNSLYKPDEVESERTVIVSERQGAENDPFFLLSQEVEATAFRIHPYHHQVLGDPIDIETISRADLYQHYRTYYCPNNAIAVLVGAVDTQQALARIEALFGNIPAGNLPTPFVRTEPPQRGEKRVEIVGDGETQYLIVAYHGPSANDPDFFPMIVLESALSGPGSLNQFGGESSNRTSRLYKALVSSGLAATVGGGLYATVDPYLYSLYAIPVSEVNVEKLVSVIDQEIERISTELISPAELAKLHKQAKAAFAFSAESVSNLGYWYGFSEILADYSWFTQFLTRLEAVTAEDVLRVAKQYLRRENRVVGTYLAQGANSSEEID
ncbi:MAG TPA: pitrilysin family protein [Anaerolineales bacterium]|nr:pitrilysin family protein [Anaerolineales bacterium]